MKKILTIIAVDEVNRAIAIDSKGSLYEQTLSGMFIPAEEIPSVNELKEIMIQRVSVRRNPLYEEVSSDRFYEIEDEL